MHKNPTGTSSSIGGRTDQPIEEDSNKNLTFTKDLKAGLLDVKYQIDVQALLSQLNNNAQGKY